jgi:hypothetical protein
MTAVLLIIFGLIRCVYAVNEHQWEIETHKERVWKNGFTPNCLTFNSVELRMESYSTGARHVPSIWNYFLYGRVLSSGIWRRVVLWVSTDVSEEHIASIFRVEEINSAKTSKQAGGICLPPACLLVSCWTYFFDPEDGSHMFLWNVGWNSADYTASYPRR